MKKLVATLALALAVATAGGSLVACGSSESGKEGGTLRISFAASPELDPQLAYSMEGWNAAYNTWIPLLTYAHASGEAGSEVIPGLAEDLPTISEDGKTYELTLRDGLRYSDGRPVKASHFKSSIERIFAIESPGTPFYTEIVGAEELLEDKAESISGIEADDASGEITIRLTAPRGTFVNELAMPFAAPVPPDTPDRDQSADPPSATGPSEIVESKPGRSFTFERNPRWRGGNAEILDQLPGGYVNRIEATVVRNEATQTSEVERGQTNWMFDPIPPDRVKEIAARYDGTQYREEQALNTYFFWMNTTRPPFDDVRVRKAVNHAIDRDALVRIYAGQFEPDETVLPPGMPGHEQSDPYPHDMAKAKRLIREANPADREITVWTIALTPNDDAGAYFQDVLRRLGFEVELKTLGDNHFQVVGNASTPDLDAGWANWFADFPHPNSFFQPLISGESIAPVYGTNLSRFDDPAITERIDELRAEQLGPEQEAAYGELDREVMEQAPLAPYGARALTLFVSADIDLDNVIWNPTFAGDLTSFRFK